jgi:hypothetical protein
MYDLVHLVTAMVMYNFHYGILPTSFDTFFPDIKHSHDTRLASGSSYSIPKIRTNYGKFNIRFIGAKTWNSLSESAKKHTKIGFKVDLKNGIIQQYSNFS